MDNDDIAALRARILKQIPQMNMTNNAEHWWLLGTVGCHLCSQAEELLTRFQVVYPLTYHHVDIADFDEALMMEFATSIPVLLTPTQRLDYPFSIMDLQQLLLCSNHDNDN